MIEQDFIYKMFDSLGNYIGILQNVTSIFSYNQNVSTTAVQTQITVAQKQPDAFTAEDNLIQVFEVNKYNINGTKIFDGYISKVKPTYGKNDILELTCISNGQDLVQ